MQQDKTKESITALEDMLNAKTVVGEPIEVGKYTIIPLVSVGFGFGSGKNDQNSQSNLRIGNVGGGGIKPVAIIIISDEGVKVENVSGNSGALEAIGEIASKAFSEYSKFKSKNDTASETEG